MGGIHLGSGGGERRRRSISFFSIIFFFLLLSYWRGHVSWVYVCVFVSFCVFLSFHIFGTERAWTHLGCCIEDIGSLF